MTMTRKQRQQRESEIVDETLDPLTSRSTNRAVTTASLVSLVAIIINAWVLFIRHLAWEECLAGVSSSSLRGSFLKTNDIIECTIVLDIHDHNAEFSYNSLADLSIIATFCRMDKVHGRLSVKVGLDNIYYAKAQFTFSSTEGQALRRCSSKEFSDYGYLLDVGGKKKRQYMLNDSYTNILNLQHEVSCRCATFLFYCVIWAQSNEFSSKRIIFSTTSPKHSRRNKIYLAP